MNVQIFWSSLVDYAKALLYIALEFLGASWSCHGF